MLRAMPDARPKSPLDSDHAVRLSVAREPVPPAKEGGAVDADIVLVRRVASGDEVAFEALVERHQDRVFSFCCRLLNDRAEAEDVAQDVFLTLYRRAGEFREESSFTTWLLRIAKNQSLNRIKYLDRRGRFERRSIQDVGEERLHAADPRPEVRAPDAIVEGDQTTALVKQAIAALEPEQRAVVVLRDVEDLSYEEIAGITGLPVGTVKSRIHRGRSALANILKRIF